MKIFIAGAKSIKDINDDVKVKLLSISDKHYDVLVGDCSGVDTAIQRFFLMHQYSKITVFASNGKARNNLGNWPINNVFVEEGIKGFDFYRQKDIAMAKEADFGFMIWDGKSKGTLNNIIELVKQDKQVLIYLVGINKMVLIKDFESLYNLIDKCDSATQSLFRKYISVPNTTNHQLTFFE